MLCKCERERTSRMGCMRGNGKIVIKLLVGKHESISKRNKKKKRKKEKKQFFSFLRSSLLSSFPSFIHSPPD